MSRVFVRPLKTSAPLIPVVPVTANSLFFSGLTNVAFPPQQLMPSGGTPPYTFGAIGLPAGISIDPVTGIISGTPTVQGSTTAIATVTDSLGAFKNVPIFFAVEGETLFSDNFARVTTAGAGEQYVSGPQPAVIEATGANVFTDGAALSIQANSVNANIRTSVCFWPKVLIPFVKFSQFAQCTLIQDNSSAAATAALRGGLFVLAGWETANLGYRDYGVSWAGPDGGANQNSVRLRRMNGVSAETQLAQTATGTVFVNDVLRIEVVVSAGQNDITVFRNGGAVLMFSDNNVLRPREGQPGIGRMIWSSGGAPGLRTWRANAFSCGIL